MTGRAKIVVGPGCGLGCPGCGLGCLGLAALCGLVGWAFLGLDSMRAVARFGLLAALGLLAAVPVGIGLWFGGIYLLDAWDSWRRRRAHRRAWEREAKEGRR